MKIMAGAVLLQYFGAGLNSAHLWLWRNFTRIQAVGTDWPNPLGETVKKKK